MNLIKMMGSNVSSTSSTTRSFEMVKIYHYRLLEMVFLRGNIPSFSTRARIDHAYIKLITFI